MAKYDSFSIPQLASELAKVSSKLDGKLKKQDYELKQPNNGSKVAFEQRQRAYEKVAQTASLLTTAFAQDTKVVETDEDDGGKSYTVWYHQEFDSSLTEERFPHTVKKRRERFNDPKPTNFVVSTFNDRGELVYFVGNDSKEAYRHLYYRYKASCIEAIQDDGKQLGDSVRDLINELDTVISEEEFVLNTIFGGK